MKKSVYYKILYGLLLLLFISIVTKSVLAQAIPGQNWWYGTLNSNVTTYIGPLSQSDCENNVQSIESGSGPTASGLEVTAGCFQSDTNPNIPYNLDPENSGGANSDGEYKLLEPIGGFESFDTTGECKFVEYLNILIKILIGISAVLAMIMIIYNGIEYMTTDLVPHKHASLEKLQNALLGLLIALGAWIILNTINPNLLNFCLSKQLPDAEVTLENEVEDYPGDFSGQDLGFAPGGAIGKCTEGLVQVSSYGGVFFACKSIAYTVQLMINSAHNNIDQFGNSDPIKISVWGFRTRQRQIELRAQNCGGGTHYNIYEKPSSQCRPPTARPGASRHESGLAFDIACEGKTIKDRSNKCYRWLDENAHKYKLFNLPSEPWHWSIDGN